MRDRLKRFSSDQLKLVLLVGAAILAIMVVRLLFYIP
jgi:hypothetical protein